MPIDPSMVKWDDAPTSAPAIDPRMVKWQDVQQPSQPISRMDKVMMGVADPIQGGAQLLTHMLPSGVVQAGNDLNNWLADKTGLVARLPAGGVDQQTKEREAAYQAQRAAAGESGFDGYRVVGNVLSPANLAIAGKGMQIVNGAKVLGGALVGGASALMNPVSGDDYAAEKGKQVAIGTATGGASSALMGGLSRIISPKASVNPDIALLKSEGVTPTIGQALGGTANKLEQKLTSAPFMGDAIVGARTRALDQFNSAAINRATAPIGVKINQTGAEGVARAQQAISQAYDDALGQIKAVKLDGQFSQDFGQLQQLTRGLTPPMRAKFDQVTANVLGGRAGTTGTMTAETFKRVDSELGNIASKYQGSAVASEKELGDAVAQLGALLKQQAGRSNPQAAQALKAADTAYANLVRVEGAANKSVTSELFTPGQLASTVRQADASVRHRANAAGNALMQDLAGAGQRVLGNNVPDSGTAGRMLPFLTGAGAVASPVATGIGLLGGTTLYSKPVQGLLSGLVTSRPEAAQAVGNSLLKAAPGFGPLGAQMGIGLLGYPSP